MIVTKYSSDKNVHKGAIYIAIVLALIPLFNYSIGGRGLFLYLGFLLAIVSLTLPHYTRIDYVYLSYFLFTIYDFLTFAWDFEGSSSLFQYIKLAFYVILIIMVRYTVEEIRLILYLQLVLGIIIILILDTTTNTMIAIGEYLTDSERAILVVGGVQIDPNYAAMLMFPVSIFCLRLLLEKNIKFYFRLLAGILILLQLYACLRSGTRGGLLAVAVGYLFYFLRKRGVLERKAILTVLLIVAAFFIVPVMMNFLPETISRRFSLANLLSSGGSGRLEYWITCLNHIDDSLWTIIFGHGKGAALVLLGIASHNTFIDCLYNGGIIQFSLFLFLLISLYRKAGKCNNLYAQALLCSYVTMCMTVSVGSNMYFWSGIAIIIIFSKLSEEDLTNGRIKWRKSS